MRREARSGIIGAMIRPPRLRPGARVALVSPAGPSMPDRIEAALARCRHFDLEPVLAPSAGETLGYLAGPDEVRRADLQAAFDDPSVDAVWAIRGGYGTMRVLPRLDFAPLVRRPKAFVGFSDNTALHLALARAGLVSFHGPHAGGSFPALAERCFRDVLFEAAPAGPLPPAPSDPTPRALVGGVAEGELIGGNLAMLAALCGTPWALEARGRIVVIEDVGETVYRIDRMLVQLALAGALEGAAGIAFGRFTDTPATDAARPLETVLEECALSLGVPAVMELPVGHVDENWTLPFGVRARLDADAGTLELIEPAVE